MAKQALGRGLGALMGGTSGKPPGTAAISPASAPAPASAASPTAEAPGAPTGEPGERVRLLAIAQIRPCALQPRKDFPEESLRELGDSMRAQGVLQPLIVRPRNGAFELIAGERRWRAAQLIGLAELPAIVREADDRKVLELALIENLQRENLNAIEEALGYSRLIQDFSLTQEEAAARVGKSRATVANLLRLLNLHPDIQNYLRTNLLTFGHARAILGITHADSQKQLAEEVIRGGLSVRETEQLVAARAERNTAAPAGQSSSSPKKPPVPDAHVAALQNRLQERFGTKVALRYRKGRGAVEIRFYNDDDLDRILGIAGIKMD